MFGEAFIALRDYAVDRTDSRPIYASISLLELPDFPQISSNIKADDTRLMKAEIKA